MLWAWAWRILILIEGYGARTSSCGRGCLVGRVGSLTGGEAPVARILVVGGAHAAIGPRMGRVAAVSEALLSVYGVHVSVSVLVVDEMRLI